MVFSASFSFTVMIISFSPSFGKIVLNNRPVRGERLTKAKKWKIAIIVLLGFVATVLIAIGEGRFWKYQENYIPDGTY